MTRSRDACSICGSPLVAGACPNGHPQRSVRARRRRRGPLMTLALGLILAAAAVYGALVWYPVRAAGQLMRPSSVEFTQALEAYRDTVAAFPATSEPDLVAESAARVLNTAEAARNSLSAARDGLEGRTSTTLPVVSDRPALRLADGVRVRMLAYYAAALEAVTDLEGVAGYLTEVAPLVPQLDNIRTALDRPRTRRQVRQSLAATRPIAERFRRQLRRIRPPEELSAVHASFLAVARSIRPSLDEIRQVGRGGRSPLLTALLRGVRERLGEFAELAGQAPVQALRSGLAARLAALDQQAEAIVDGLDRLRTVHEVEGLTTPRD